MSYSPPVLASERMAISVSTSSYCEVTCLASGFPAPAAWPTANLAIFVPLYIQTGVTIQQIWWNNGATITGSTSLECAVYNEGGTSKLITSGVVTHAGASIPQAVVVAGGLHLPRGRYWIGMVVGNNTSTFIRWTNNAAVTNMQKMLGTSEQALGSTALPSTITFGAAAQAYIPDMGISSSALVI